MLPIIKYNCICISIYKEMKETFTWKGGRGLAGIIKFLRFAPKRYWMRGGKFVRIESWLSCPILLTSYLAGFWIACMYFKWYH